MIDNDIIDKLKELAENTPDNKVDQVGNRASKKDIYEVLDKVKHLNDNAYEAVTLLHYLMINSDTRWHDFSLMGIPDTYIWAAQLLIKPPYASHETYLHDISCDYYASKVWLAAKTLPSLPDLFGFKSS